jgi:outer membrane protein assembly factor BamE (lipoprotein component of BamABCDE complex)
MNRSAILLCAALAAVFLAPACRTPEPNISGSVQTTYRSGQHFEWTSASPPSAPWPPNDERAD